MRRGWLIHLLLIAALNLVAACSSSKGPETKGSESVVAQPAANVSLNKADYPVFPDADTGADPSVPADQGGKGFTGQGWETNTDFDLIGDPRAVKGGVLRDYMPNFPGTWRMGGPEWNTETNYEVNS